MNYYNEYDPFAAAWLRELIKSNLIPNGVVDTRSICDVKPSDLDGFTQVHFFAGIGGWSLALRLAGWPDDRPVWTGSCPCQAFSSAGKGEGFNDPRHLWPVFNRLISECRPPIVFGEQVEAAVGHGWLDLVATDLEAQGYAFGTAVLGAHSVGSPHRRQRIYWVGSDSLANAASDGYLRGNMGDEVRQECTAFGGREDEGSGRNDASDGCASIRGVAQGDAIDPRPQGHDWHGDNGNQPGRIDAHAVGPVAEAGGASSGSMGNTERGGRQPQQARPFLDGKGMESGGRQQIGGVEAGRDACGMADALHTGRPERRTSAGSGSTSGSSLNAWSDSYWLPCRDGKARQVPTEPALFPLVNAGAFRNRVGLLRGAGNAIVPQVAAEFIRACS